MNQPLVDFFQGLISCHPLADPAEVQIVQDNCGKLTEEARGLVRLSYRSSLTSDISCSTRWDTCRDAPKTKISKKDVYSFCNLPSRRSSMDASSSAAPIAVDKIPQLPPRNPTQRSAQRWLIALEDLEYVSSSDEEDDDDEYSTSDSDSETTYTAGDLDFDQCFSDSDSDDDDDTIMDDHDYPERTPNPLQTDRQWGGKAINAHEWTFPPNAILPNLQEMFREAALNRDVDINQRIKALAMGEFPQVG